MQFFSSNGFPCPTLQNPPDHFLKTINKDFEEVKFLASKFLSHNSIEFP